MKFNRFTKKALEKEFPWLSTYLNGQLGIWEGTCPVHGKVREEAESRPFQCPTPTGGERVPGFRASFACCEVVTDWVQTKPYYRPRKDPEEVLVKKVDENFLRHIPESYSWDGSVVGIDRGSTIHFVTKDSEFHGPVMTDDTSGSNYAHSETSYNDGESVAHAIDRLGIDPKAITAIAEWQYGIRTIEHYSEGRRLLIWKAAKAQGTIAAVIAAMYEEAATQVAAEANF